MNDLLSCLFFACCSASPNRHFLKTMARLGCGAADFFDSRKKSKWETKVKDLLDKSTQQGLTSVKVDWQQFDDNACSPLQAPQQVTSLFNGCRQVVYGLVPFCTKATLSAEIDGYTVSTMVSTPDLNITQGTVSISFAVSGEQLMNLVLDYNGSLFRSQMLHQLTARALIRDWDEGVLDQDATKSEMKKLQRKDSIIKMSQEFSIVSPYTSFVAIEHREPGEESRQGPSVDDLIAKENVDILPYISWERTDKVG